MEEGELAVADTSVGGPLGSMDSRDKVSTNNAILIHLLASDNCALICIL